MFILYQPRLYIDYCTNPETRYPLTPPLANKASLLTFFINTHETFIVRPLVHLVKKKIL